MADRRRTRYRIALPTIPRLPYLAQWAAVALVLVCCGCSGRPQQGVLVPVANSASGTSRVTVLAATMRKRSANDPGEMFNGERALEMSYASVAVSIPPDSAREIGRIQWPELLPGDPARNFVTVQAGYLQKPDFVSALVPMTKQGAARGRVLIFVHGFNNRFDDAVYRFAQIVHDSHAPGVPVLFTWPSRGEIKLRAYTYDRESASYSRDAFEELLDTLSRLPSVTEINILAHSMGNWVVLEALRTRAIKAGRVGDKVKNVMLVAPDVDVDVFRTQISRMGKARPRFAVFVSQDDSALALSKTIWGGVPRLGDVDPEQDPYRGEFASERIEVFDLTKLKTAGDNAHDRAFEDVTSVVAMVKERLKQGQELSERKTDFSLDR